jgi:hypothetical protein
MAIVHFFPVENVEFYPRSRNRDSGLREMVFGDETLQFALQAYRLAVFAVLAGLAMFFFLADAAWGAAYGGPEKIIYDSKGIHNDVVYDNSEHTAKYGVSPGVYGLSDPIAVWGSIGWPGGGGAYSRHANNISYALGIRIRQHCHCR